MAAAASTRKSDGGAQVVSIADDETAQAMEWWAALSQRDRARWQRAAGDTGKVVDAWRAFQKVEAERLDLLDLEVEVNDLADMAKLLSASAEAWIEGGATSQLDGQAKALMFAIRQIEHRSAKLRERYYLVDRARG